MRDTVVEGFLNKWGSSYKYHESIPLASINLTEAAKQNIRPVGVDEDVVLKYALDMEDGADFPALVLYGAKGTDKFEVLTGCHRIEGAKVAGRKGFDAYVLALDKDKDSRTIEVLQRVLNTINGLGYGKEERIQHALRIVHLGYSITDAARMMGLNKTTLNNRMGAIAARDRARSMNIVLSGDLIRDTALLEIGRIKNPDLFRAVAELAQAARLTSEQVKDLSGDIRNQPTDALALAAMERWREKMADVIKETSGGRFAGPTSPARRALTYLDRLNRTVKAEAFAALTGHERREVVRQLKAHIVRLQKLVAQLQAPLALPPAQEGKGGRRAAGARTTH